MSAGLFYASTSGRTRKVAELIARGLGGAGVEVRLLREARPEDLLAYRTLILGSPTYGVGDLHPDWLAWRDAVERLDLSGRTVALFALGDQRYHGRTFAGALKHLDLMVRYAGVEPVGRWPGAGYEFKQSPALGEDGMFPGLVLDEVNQRRQTEERVRTWIAGWWPSPSPRASPGME